MATNITCDNCNEELTTDTPYPHKFTLELSIIDTNYNTSGATFAVHMTPPFIQPKHFCDKKCLAEWATK